MKMIQILIVDDHPVLRRGIKSLLSNNDDFVIVGEAPDLDTARAKLRELQPDIVLLDIRLSGESGLDLLEDVQTMTNAPRVLILTSFDDDEYVLDALKSGAHGYLLKNVSDEMLCDAIRTVHQNGHVLSPCVTDHLVRQLTDHNWFRNSTPTFTEEELDLLHRIVLGANNDQIASDLFVSVATVKRKLRKVFDKLNVQNRAQAAAEAVQRGLV